MPFPFEFAVRGLPLLRDEAQPADTVVREADQAVAEGGGLKAVTNRESGAMGAVLGRSHGVKGDVQLVQSACARQPCIVGRVEQRCGAAQQLTRVLARQMLKEAFRRDTGPASEKSLEVVLAQTDGCRDLA